MEARANSTVESCSVGIPDGRPKVKQGGRKKYQLNESVNTINDSILVSESGVGILDEIKQEDTIHSVPRSAFIMSGRMGKTVAGGSPAPVASTGGRVLRILRVDGQQIIPEKRVFWKL